MGRFKRFYEIEKSLEKKFSGVSENQVFLKNEDFKNGKLTAPGYDKLKQECDYIEFHQDIEIKVPEGKIGGYKESVEYMAVNEIKRIKKDRKYAYFIAVGLLFFGAVWFALGQIFAKANMVKEITLVATWVFTWAAIEKIFFDRRSLRMKRLNLLHILSANISEYKD